MTTHNPDRALDRTLAALNDAQPSAGFNERVLQFTQAAADRSQRKVPAWHRLPAVALSAATLALVFVLTVQFGAFPTKAKRTSRHASSRPHIPSLQHSQSTNAALATEQNPLPRPKISPTSTVLSAIAPARPTGELTPPAPSVPTLTAALDVQAAEDLTAPSHPAPPLASTAQERLVRLMLRRGEKHDLAQLESASQTLRSLEDGAELHDFFDPPVPRLEEQQPASLLSQPAVQGNTAVPANTPQPAVGDPQ